ncbi:CBS domain-containing protein [bacterium]|nr:CBS domain-containing protein [bacterium]
MYVRRVIYAFKADYYMKKLLVAHTISVREAMKRLNQTAEKILLVVDSDNRLLGTLTDGDIRRHLIANGDMTWPVVDVYNPSPISIQAGLPETAIKELFLQSKVDVIPVVNDQGQVVDYLTWTVVFDADRRVSQRATIDVPVVVMAGGRGTRLEPFTKIIPKPLIPIGDKPILELIMEEFTPFGVHDFLISVNYKGELIKSYFDTIETPYSIQFLWEKEFQGTAGSLKLAKPHVDGTMIVTNCDVIVKADYADVLKFHRDRRAMLTVLSAVQHHTIPYGVIEYENGGKINQIREKPEQTFTVNTGIYVLEKAALDFIPDAFFNMTDLIDALLAANQTVLMYPVNEDDFVDIGHWDEFKRAISILRV